VPIGHPVNDGPRDPDGPCGPCGPCGPVLHPLPAEPSGPTSPADCVTAAHDAVYAVIVGDDAALADITTLANEELSPA